MIAKCKEEIPGPTETITYKGKILSFDTKKHQKAEKYYETWKPVYIKGRKYYQEDGRLKACMLNCLMYVGIQAFCDEPGVRLGFPEPLIFSLNLLIECGNLEEALQSFELINFNYEFFDSNDYIRMLAQYGSLLLRMNYMPESKVIVDFIRSNPNAAIWDAKYFYKVGDYRMSIDKFKRAYEIAPNMKFEHRSYVLLIRPRISYFMTNKI